MKKAMACMWVAMMWVPTLWMTLDAKDTDETWRITNPSFETGDETGWTLTGKDPNGNDEFRTRDYGMSGKEGRYVMNAYQWWAPSLSVSQTVEGVPSGVYELSAVVATWEGRTVTFGGNVTKVTAWGQGADTGIAVKVMVTVGTDQRLTISAGSTGQWWLSGHGGETQTFFKLDDVRLVYKGAYRNTFTVAALNVDGLPNKIATVELNADGPGSDGTKKISQYLSRKGYDIIGASEDFNYHGSLMESLNDRYSSGTVRTTLSVGGISWSDLLSLRFRFDTDGLNLIWKNDHVSAANESWTQWESMVATDGNQYVKKGYRHYDVTVDGGYVVDVYVLHMDAGDTNATESRESQWRQLAGAVNAADASHPKLIIGDTNSRWTREDISTNFVQRLDSRLVMSDVWVEGYRGHVCPTTDMDDLTDKSDPVNYTNYEVVDKIIYINPVDASALHLMPASFRIEQDYTYGTVDGTDNTKALGDHNPVVVEFACVMEEDWVERTCDLKDAEENRAVIASYAGETVPVTLSGRTLYKDGTWNTLCLPFALTADQRDASPLADATIRAWDVDNTFASDGTLYFAFQDVDGDLEVGMPYIVRWTETGDDVVNPTFTDVTIEAGDARDVVGGVATFRGVYDPVELQSNQTNLYLGTGNQLYSPDPSLYTAAHPYVLNAFRAYFLIDEARTNEAGIRNFVMDGDGGEVIKIFSPAISPMAEKVQWRTLDGRRLNARPTVRGVYLAAGKKVWVK